MEALIYTAHLPIKRSAPPRSAQLQARQEFGAGRLRGKGTARSGTGREDENKGRGVSLALDDAFDASKGGTSLLAGSAHATRASSAAA